MLIFTTIKEIPEFPYLVGRQACLLTNRAALHPPKADAGGQRDLVIPTLEFYLNYSFSPLKNAKTI